MHVMKKAPLLIGAIALVLVFSTAVPQSWAQGKGHGHGRGQSTVAAEHHHSGRAFGHLIAPGWLKKHHTPNITGTLPRGIEKRLGGASTTTDITAPRISDIRVSPATTSVNISWDTNERASAQVFLSTTTPVQKTASGTLTQSANAFTRDHAFTFSGLASGTTYHGIIVVTDKLGNERASAEFSFTTTVIPDTVAPIISVMSTSTGSSTATVTWTTNEPATGQLYVATTSGFGIGDSGVLTTSVSTLSTSHALTMTGLSTSTTYFARIASKDAANNTTLSSQFSVVTTP